VRAGDFIGRLVAALDAAHVPYMVTGSFASSEHGVPRSTNDIDIVIDPSREALDTFLTLLPPDAYYVDADVARDALRRRTMFNVIDMASSWKADLVVRKNRPFSIEEIRRRIPGMVDGTPCVISTREDTILSKLEWEKASGGSERQLDDVAGIIAVSGASLDRAYIDRWAAELGVAELWARVRGG
jgi:hypothetical protein